MGRDLENKIVTDILNGCADLHPEIIKENKVYGDTFETFIKCLSIAENKTHERIEKYTWYFRADEYKETLKKNQ